MKTYLYFLLISCWILLKMRNYYGKRCWGNQNTHYILSNFFLKILPFMGCGKIWWSLTGHRQQCNMARAVCVLDHWGYTHILWICPLQQQLREHASVLRYTYIAFLVFCSRGSICLIMWTLYCKNFFLTVSDYLWFWIICSIWTSSD